MEETRAVNPRRETRRSDRPGQPGPRGASHARLSLDGCISPHQHAGDNQRQLCLQVLQVSRHQGRDQAQGALSAKKGEGSVPQPYLYHMGDRGPSPPGDRVGYDGFQVLLLLLRGDLLLRCLHQGDPVMAGRAPKGCQGTVHRRTLGRGGTAERQYGTGHPAYGPGQCVRFHGLQRTYQGHEHHPLHVQGRETHGQPRQRSAERLDQGRTVRRVPD